MAAGQVTTWGISGRGRYQVQGTKGHGHLLKQAQLLHLKHGYIRVSINIYQETRGGRSPPTANTSPAPVVMPLKASRVL